MIVCLRSTSFDRNLEKSLHVFNPTRVDVTIDGVPSKFYSQGKLSGHFYEEVYSIRDVSTETG